MLFNATAQDKSINISIGESTTTLYFLEGYIKTINLFNFSNWMKI
jgi:hypothetical protein